MPASGPAGRGRAWSDPPGRRADGLADWCLWLGVWLGLLGCLTGSGRALADDLPSRPEHEIKALYIYNFTKYITWPPVKTGPPLSDFTIGVLAPPEITEDLTRLTRDKRRDGAAFVIRPISAPKDAAGCQIVVLMTPDRQIITNLLAATKSAAVLTVGEGEDFVMMGGMISFVRRKANVKLQIELESARRAGLELSSRLLQVAELVRPESSPKQ